MRNFLASLICLSIILSIWGVFTVYSGNMSEALQAQSEKLISGPVQENNWTSAENEYNKLNELWTSYKKHAAIFLDSKEINEIDCTLGKAHLYLKAEDVSNSTGEFSYLKDKFKALHKNDTVTFSNIL